MIKQDYSKQFMKENKTLAFLINLCCVGTLIAGSYVILAMVFETILGIVG